MKKHLYNSRIGKISWFIQRFGLSEVFLKPLRVGFAPLILPCLTKRTFRFDGVELEYFYHRYNMTWANERCLEVPIAKFVLDQSPKKRVLEVGNVLSHYFPASHDILDKYEKGKQVINQDIIDFQPHQKYDLILSISTFEHIGFDDEMAEGSTQKIAQAVEACINLLAAGGRFIMTVPMGYNPELDSLLREDRLPLSREIYFRRQTRWEWINCSKREALQCRFKTPYPYANGLLVGEAGGPHLRT
jgi:hypothetical protein